MNVIEMPVEQTPNGLPAEDESRYVSTEEAAEWLGLTDGRIKQLLAEGKLTGYKLERRRKPEERLGWYIEKDSIRRYEKYREAIKAANQILKGETDD